MNNKLIENLAEQATVDTRFLSRGQDSVGPWKKRFAELIVRECASMAIGGPREIQSHFGLKDE